MSGTGPDAATVQLVRDRDDNACVRCGTTLHLTTQHRVSRGMGGSRNRPWVNLPGNLISLCGSGTTGCHGWVEHHPVEAKDYGGWALSRFITNPQDQPVRYPDGWYLLDNDGGRHAIGRYPGGSTGGRRFAVHSQDVGAAVPEPDAAARLLAPPFPV